MADAAFDLKIVTPEHVFFEGKTVSVVAPGTLGYLGILKNHAPLVTTIEPGRLTTRDLEGKTTSYQVNGGFLEVLRNKVLILTDSVKAMEA